MFRGFLPPILVAFSLVACADDACEPEEEEEEGVGSGATCTDPTLTYETFAQPFMKKYCTSCHSSKLAGEEARHCAPTEHDVDTREGILLIAAHVDEHAAAGPNAVNTEMPPAGYKKPTLAERQNLGIWLACECQGTPGDPNSLCPDTED